MVGTELAPPPMIAILDFSLMPYAYTKRMRSVRAAVETQAGTEGSRSKQAPHQRGLGLSTWVSRFGARAKNSPAQATDCAAGEATGIAMPAFATQLGIVRPQADLVYDRRKAKD